MAGGDLEIILRAGINAPSAWNRQPWYFSAVCDQTILEEMEQSMGFTPPPGRQIPPPGGAAQPPWGLSLSSAKVAIVISGASELSTDSFDCGLACQSMSIAAMVLGYGTKITFPL